MRLSNTDKVKGMSYEEILDKFPEEICKCCFWPEESHHPESLCEGRYCEEALKKWLEDDSEPLLTHFSLFSGIGGLDLAAEWAGFTTVGQCEKADYPTKVLEKHWPKVPRWRDICDVTADNFYEKTGLHTVTVISGGFPCQDISTANTNGKGLSGERSGLWYEMLRTICEIRPRWVVAENTPRLLTINNGKDFGTILRGLAESGYNAEWSVLSACSMGAPHTRERLFIVAYANSERLQACWDKRISNDAIGYERYKNSNDIQKTTFAISSDRRNAWRSQPRVPGILNGVPNRIHRNKCLGNAVVPQQAYPIFKTIADIEKKY
jgi:DNA (cytosine-5)-methyltransferase 1